MTNTDVWISKQLHNIVLKTHYLNSITIDRQLDGVYINITINGINPITESLTSYMPITKF